MPPSNDSKRLPEANEFSPGQVDLRTVLKLASEHAGDRAGLVEAIRRAYFADAASSRSDPAERLEQQTKRANNVVIGMKGYGLFDLESNRLTPVGEALLATPDEATLMPEFAAHILKNCHGLELLEAVRDIQARGEEPTKARLQAELEGRGFKLPRATTHHTKALQWLRAAGVIDASKNIDEQAVASLTGMSLGTLEEWSALTPEQQAFLRTLRRLGDVHGASPLPARDVLTQAKLEHGSIFREDQLASRVYKPLSDVGWIEHSVGVGGRGGKSGDVSPTDKLLALDLGLLPVDDQWGIPSDLRPKLNTPLADIERDLASEDKHSKGIALELLALRMAVDAGLTPLRFRLRASETGGAEVDLIAEGAHLHFSRWLFQCKNTKTVALSEVAKEVGMATVLRAHIILIVTTGAFAKSVRPFARQVVEVLPLQVVLIDKAVLAKYRAGGGHALMNFLHSEAEATLRLKRSQIARDSAAAIE
jgi:hypothetical protein